MKEHESDALLLERKGTVNRVIIFIIKFLFTSTPCKVRREVNSKLTFRQIPLPY